ncbi:hypothetical protein Ddc_02586 [Ditylenchus destructor]|nr:hypothetical protein Ddc_02586 [Ditylenchus destructor]
MQDLEQETESIRDEFHILEYHALPGRFGNEKDEPTTAAELKKLLTKFGKHENLTAVRMPNNITLGIEAHPTDPDSVHTIPGFKAIANLLPEAPQPIPSRVQVNVTTLVVKLVKKYCTDMHEIIPGIPVALLVNSLEAGQNMTVESAAVLVSYKKAQVVALLNALSRDTDVSSPGTKRRVPAVTESEE